MRYVHSFILAQCCALLMACGQKGPLYLPGPNPPAAQETSGAS